ncbi:MAG: hypothetical protein HZA61_10825 [Candidatus Eisenbacteria bacterium]|uniref:Uncharacterized protein n=1 Tax=Eiseniibacteriota bacterium TaxID=2212470 RepID=A0A933SD76_UNCEI|nr:hypothetical protein [Candidatus Eisenbacteria bacterium]
MPVLRWKNFEDMERWRWAQPGDPENWPRFCGIMAFAGAVVRVHRPPGAHRFRTIEEMQEFQAGWRIELIGQGKDLPPARRGDGLVADAPRTPFGKMPSS